jgi:endonuclease YncB( thermonuclease family)
MEESTIQKLKSFNYDNTDQFSFNGLSTFCRIVDVIDGDTLCVIFNLNDKFYRFIIRLDGIDTCEIKSIDKNIHQKGIDAKNYVISTLCSSNNIKNYDLNFTKKETKEFFNNNFVIAYISCKEFDKFGRILANVYLCNNEYNSRNNLLNENSLSNLLLNKKLAYPYFGETKMSDEEIKKYFKF